MSSPSTVTNQAPIAALDVGGTTIKSGLVLSDDRVIRIERTRIDADSDQEELVADLARVLRPLLERHVHEAIHHVRIAFPGPFDYAEGRPRLRHKFASLHGLDLASLLRDRLRRDDLRIEFVNDAEAAAVGEALRGAGRGGNRVLTVTLGTGFGAAMTVAGQPIQIVGQHVVGKLYTRFVQTSAEPCCQGRADDEFCASGLARRLGVRPSQLAEAEGDPAHAEALCEYGTDLGGFLGKVAAELAADRIVIGGGAIPRSVHFDGAVTAALPTPWARAELGTAGALIGAARMQVPTRP